MNISITDYTPYGDAQDPNGSGEIFTVVVNAGTEAEAEYTYDAWSNETTSGEEWRDVHDGSTESPLTDEEAVALGDVLEDYRVRWNTLWDEKVQPRIDEVRAAMLPYASEIE